MVPSTFMEDSGFIIGEPARILHRSVANGALTVVPPFRV